MPYAVFGKGHGESLRVLIPHFQPVLMSCFISQEVSYGTS